MTLAADLAFGQMLKQQATADTARLGIVARGHLDQARNLFRLLEIMLGRLTDRRPFERDDALIALGGACLVQREHQLLMKMVNNL